MWRLSLADLPTASIFSRVGNVDRTFTLVGASGAELDIGAHRIRCEPLDPVEFAGEDGPGCTAPHPTQAFNLMVARGLATGRVRPHVLDRGKILSIDAHENLMTAVFVVSGTGILRDTSLGTGDTALIDSGRATFIPTTRSGQTKVLHVSVADLAGAVS